MDVELPVLEATTGERAVCLQGDNYFEKKRHKEKGPGLASQCR